MSKRKRGFALCGGICGAAYLAHEFLYMPDFCAGLTLGLGVCFMVMSLLPDEIREQLRKWKQRGE